MRFILSSYTLAAALALGFFATDVLLPEEKTIPVFPFLPERSTDIASAIVPHHLVAEEMIVELFATIAEAEPKTIILISPDHWGRAQSSLVTTTLGRYEGATVDSRLIADWIHAEPEMLGADDELLADEHGVNGLMPLLNAHFPEITFVPIAVSATMEEEALEAIAQTLNALASKETVVIASTDFSHYLPSSAADFHDAKTLSAIERFDLPELRETEVDCWQCLYLATRFAELRGAHTPELLAHSNSGKILGVEDTAPETTSYATFVFRDGASQPPAPTSTLLFVGDMMFGRSVETQMQTHGLDYPFEKIAQLLRGLDVVYGNLEGPIDPTHTQTPTDSVQFSFVEDIGRLLAKYEFDAVSLANNHGLDQGSVGYDFTKTILAEAGVDFSGHATQIGDLSTLHMTVQETPYRFAAFNVTFPFIDETETVAAVASLEETSSDPIIVNIHWGIEYDLVSSAAQQELAHALIDAGADLVIGHHPHVVQEIEEYNGVLIFYSLGNFIFDQYWSEETQKGLAVGMEVHENETIYRLFPIQSQVSQPSLMNPEEANTWLAELAARSDEELKEEIEKGIMSVTK